MSRDVASLGLFVAALVFGGPHASLAAFTDVTAEYGLAQPDDVSWAASFVDYDGDGDNELYVSDHWRLARLYRNDGGAPLVPQNEPYGPQNSDRHDALWGDFDGDGAPDQYIIQGGGRANELFWNLGNGNFQEGAGAAGVDEPNGRGREITLADFDLDGNLDIYLANVVWSTADTDSSVLFWNQGDGTFLHGPSAHPLFGTGRHCSSADYDLDGYPDILVTHPFIEKGELYRNDGSGGWDDVTASAFAGIDPPLRRAQGLAWADYDDDGDLDLFAGWGDYGFFDFATLEQDSIRFWVKCVNEVKSLKFFTNDDSVTVFAQVSNFQFPTCWYGGDGDSVTTFPATFALSDIEGEPPAYSLDRRGVFLWSQSGLPPETAVLFAVKASSTQQIKVGGHVRTNGDGILYWSKTNFDDPPPWYQGDLANRLLRNEGDGTFEDVTASALAVNDASTNCAGAAWADYDNDGRIDVYVTNAGTLETGNQPNQLYRNNGDGTFTEVAAAEGVQGSLIGQSDGAAWGDVNGDGFLDLFLNHGGYDPPLGHGPRQLFLNVPNGNHWIGLWLRGLSSNGSGIGARVRFVTASGARWRTLLGDSGNGYAEYLGIHAGLGADAICDTVQVYWPSGLVDTHVLVAADAKYVAVEGEALRPLGAPQLTLDPNEIFDAVPPFGERQYWIDLGNEGGAPVDYAVTVEECGGAGAGWLSVDRSAGFVWPGGTPYGITVTVDVEIMPPGSYCGRLVFASNSVTSPDTVDVSIVVGDPSATGPAGTLPARLSLEPGGRNPTAGESAFRLALPTSAPVEVAIFDVRGRRVRTLLAADRPAGYHPVVRDGRDARGRRAGPGVYWVRAVAGSERVVRKLTVVGAH